MVWPHSCILNTTVHCVRFFWGLFSVHNTVWFPADCALKLSSSVRSCLNKMVRNLITRCFAFGNRKGHPLVHVSLHSTNCSQCSERSTELFMWKFFAFFFEIHGNFSFCQHGGRIKVVLSWVSGCFEPFRCFQSTIEDNCCYYAHLQILTLSSQSVLREM